MTRHVRGVDFGRVWDASGVRGFFGDGYWFHRLPVGPRFQGSTFVSKTTTLDPRRGNMGEKRAWWIPSKIYPACVEIRFNRGVVLNSVALTGPGARSLFDARRWQQRNKPFMLSFMAVDPTPQERLRSARIFATLLGTRLSEFLAPVGLQVNLSCANTGRDTSSIAQDARAILGCFRGLSIPVIAKVNVLFPITAALGLQDSDLIDAICCSNALPWGCLPGRIDWEGLFGTRESPLKRFGGGALSGRPLLSLVSGWIDRLTSGGFTKHINAGGGILCPEDVRTFVRAGADSVSLGSIAILRPWRVQETINFTRSLYSD